MDLDKTWQRDGEWGSRDTIRFQICGEIAPEATEKGPKYQPFSS